MSQTQETIFNRESDVEYTNWDRFQHFFDQYVRAPFSILLTDWRTVLGLAIVGFYVLVAIVGTRIVPEPRVNQAPEQYMQPFTNMAYPLGTDHLAQDLLGLSVHATPLMFRMFLTGALFTVIVGTLVGATAGYAGGRLDTALMTVSDIVMTIPGLPLIVVLAAFFQPSRPEVIGVLIAFNMWASLARQIRSEVLSMVDLGYVKASRTMGLSLRTIVAKDIIPNIMSYVTVNFVRASRNVIFASVGLYFLGILPYETANWGVMLQQAYEASGIIVPSAWHTIIIPTLDIVILTLGLTLLAQGSDRMFNPRLRARHAKTADDAGPDLG